MKKIYTDNLAIFNVLGGILNNPALIEKYDMEPEDFGETFYQIIYKASANLYAKGLEEITVLDIDGYLRDHPKSYQTFNENGGVAVVTNAKTKTNPSSFEYHYDIMKKMSLLTSLGTIVDLDFMYDPEHPDPNVRERQRAQLLEWGIQDIMSEVDARITKIRDQHMRDTAATTGNVADGVDDLILSLMENPDLGAPLYGKYINTITRGCRTKKFYLRSAPTGAGKSRTMIADATSIATTELYNLKTNKWESTGEALPVSFIVTELDKEEVQTMCLAFLSGVNENHILRGTYQPGELDRVRKAAKLLTEGSLYITELPDFNMDDIEMAIRRNIREFGTRQIFFDYIHSSLKIFEEISRKTKGMSLREDQVLFMMSIRLKDIANELDVFIMSATQVNASYTDETAMPDQNMLRGIKMCH